MYPRLSDFFNDLLGTSFCLPIQSFGFFVALGFIVSYILFKKELKRKTQAGIFPTYQVKELVGGPLKISEVGIFALIWALIGYKAGLLFSNYNYFCENPQSLILSLEGSFLGALIVGILAAGWQYRIYLQRKDDKAEQKLLTRGLPDEIGTLLTLAFVLGILGAKIFHNLEYIDHFLEDPIGSLLSFDGLTFYGGLIVATIGIVIYVRRRGYQVWPVADAISPALMAGYGVGRMGCQTAGDGDWGLVNLSTKPDWLSWLPDWAWAYDYPNNVLREGIPIPGCLGDYCHALAQPVWPTPFYEVLMSFAIFGLLWALRKRLPYWGQMTGVYLFFNGMERFWIEKIRVNSTYHLFGRDITQAEIISSLLMIAGIAIFFLATYKWKKTADSVEIKPVAPPKG